MLDLFALARANASHIQKLFESLLAGLPPEQAGSLQTFAKWVEEEASISINAGLFVWSNF